MKPPGHEGHERPAGHDGHKGRKEQQAPVPLPAAGRASVAQLLSEAHALELERLDATALLAQAAGLLGAIDPRAWARSHDGDTLSPDQAQAAREGFARRASGEPMGYLLGRQEFHGLLLQVGPGVLVPRPDTETLVDWALACLNAAPPHGAGLAPKVIDLGTGSGAIALAVKAACPRAQVHAVDISPQALQTAQANAEGLNLAVRFHAGTWWQATPEDEFDLVLSNPPYIAEGDPHLPGLRHEPLLALTSGPDGLDALAHLALHSLKRLRPGGWLLMEHGHTQAEAVQSLLSQAGYAQVQTRPDLAGRPRCTGGQRPA